MVREIEAERIMFSSAFRRPSPNHFENIREQIRDVGVAKCILKDFGKIPWRVERDDEQETVILHTFRSFMGTLIYSFATWIVSLYTMDKEFHSVYLNMAWITALMWVSNSISISWAVIQATEGSMIAITTILVSKLTVVLFIIPLLLKGLTLTFPTFLLFVLFGIPLVLYCGIYGGFLGEFIRYKCHPRDLTGLHGQGPLLTDHQDRPPVGGFRVDVLP